MALQSKVGGYGLVPMTEATYVIRFISQLIEKAFGEASEVTLMWYVGPPDVTISSLHSEIAITPARTDYYFGLGASQV